MVQAEKTPTGGEARKVASRKEKREKKAAAKKAEEERQLRVAVHKHVLPTTSPYGERSLPDTLKNTWLSRLWYGGKIPW